MKDTAASDTFPWHLVWGTAVLFFIVYLKAVVSLGPFLSMLFIYFMGYGCVLTMPVSLVFVCIFRGRRRRQAVILFCLPLIFLALAWIFPAAHEVVFDWRLVRLTHRAAPVVAAIHAFEKDHGHPPRSLELLVPDYLSQVPSTGVGSFPEFDYCVGNDCSVGAKVLWYDLGSRQGRPPEHRARTEVGLFEHAILELTIDGNDQLVLDQTDRLPILSDFQVFDSAAWKANSSIRMPMTKSVLDKLKRGVSLTQIQEWLGPPDGEHALFWTRWELGIKIPQGLIDYYYLYYLPSHNYPPDRIGTFLRRIGDWALSVT